MGKGDGDGMLKGEPTLWELAGVSGFCITGAGRDPEAPCCCCGRGDMLAADAPIEPTLSGGPQLSPGLSTPLKTSSTSLLSICGNPEPADTMLSTRLK